MSNGLIGDLIALGVAGRVLELSAKEKRLKKRKRKKVKMVKRDVRTIERLF